MAISVENRQLFPLRVFCAPLKVEWVSFGIGYRRLESKIRMMGYRVEKEVRRYLQPCGYNTPTWQTD